jgi:hypothetical protein
MRIKILLITFFTTLGILLYSNLEKFTYIEKVEPDIEKELREKATKEFLEGKIKEAISKENIEEAKEFNELADFLQIDIDRNLTKEIQEIESSTRYKLKSLKEFGKGFITGDINSSYSLAGSITSDFTVIGDIREIYREGKKYIAGEDYDKFILTLSIVGVAFTASTVATFGTTTPIKVGVSALKVAKKSGSITKKFSKILTSKLKKSVKLAQLKKIKFDSIKSLKESSKRFIKMVNIKPIKKTLLSINQIRKNSSLTKTIKTLKYIESEKELSRAVKLSKKFKNNTPTVLKVVGKGALRGAKTVIKKSIYYTWILITSIISLLISVLLLLNTLFYLLKKRAK